MKSLDTVKKDFSDLVLAPALRDQVCSLNPDRQLLPQLTATSMGSSKFALAYTLCAGQARCCARTVQNATESLCDLQPTCFAAGVLLCLGAFSCTQHATLCSSRREVTHTCAAGQGAGSQHSKYEGTWGGLPAHAVLRATRCELPS